jgi:hypothetical protein
MDADLFGLSRPQRGKPTRTRVGASLRSHRITCKITRTSPGPVPQIEASITVAVLAHGNGKSALLA